MATTNAMDRYLVVLKTCVLVTILFGSCVFGADVSDGQANTNNSSGSAAAGSGAKGGEELSALEKGTQPLFFVTNFFLNKILQPNDSWIPAIDLGASVIGNNTKELDFLKVVNIFRQEWSKYVLHYLGFLICFGLGIIFIIVMPIVGLCFCCCRMCGRCGAKPSPMDSKHAKCKRVTFGTFLFIVTTFMLAATVCAFVTNDLIHKQTSDEQKGFVGSVINSIQNVETYVQDSARELKTTVLNKFDGTKDKIIADFQNIAKKVQTQIGELTQAGPLLDNATKLAEDVTTLRKALQLTQNLTEQLKTDSQALKGELKTIRGDIDKALSGCTTQKCLSIKGTTVDLKVNMNFSKVDEALASVDGVIAKLEDIEKKNIVGEIQKGRDAYNQISAKITKDVQSYINESEKAIRDIRGTIEKELTKLSDFLSDSVKELGKARATVKDIQPSVKKYGNYVMFGGIGLSCVLLLVVLLNYLGLMFGACGERPYEDKRACNKGVGANFLMAGVGFIFIFCVLLMFLTMILFIVGGPLETEVCRHLVDPLNSKQIEQLDEIINIGEYAYPKSAKVQLSIQEVLQNCSDNAAIYSTLKLQNVFNVSELIDDALKTVDEEVMKVAKQIEKVKIDDVILLPKEAKDLLELVKKSDYNTINFQSSLDELKKQLLGLTLSDYIALLKAVKSETGVDGALLQTNIDKLEQLTKDNGLIKKMQTNIDSLKTQMTDLSVANIVASATSLMTGLEKAQNEINTEFNKLIIEAANTTANSISQNARVLGRQLMDDLENNIGNCRPLYDALMGIINTTCKKTLYPLNGFWFAFGWCLFFFIPSLIFSVKLAGLYRKTEKYSAKEFDDVDANNYHGIYPGDNIPLNERVAGGQQTAGGGGGYTNQMYTA